MRFIEEKFYESGKKRRKIAEKVLCSTDNYTTRNSSKTNGYYQGLLSVGNTDERSVGKIKYMIDG